MRACRAGALVVLLLGCSAAVAAGPVRPLDGIVARVDQSVVTWSQVVQEQALLAWGGDAAGSADLRSVAETLVRRRLLVAEAQKMRIEVSAADVAADVRTLAAAGGAPSVFWERLKQLGLGEAELGRRCRDLLLTTRYLSLRQEMTYVPEAEVRAYYGEHGGDFKGTPLFQVREEVRALLSKKKYEQELDQWFSRQIDDGRVRVFGLPSDPAEDAPR